MKNSIMSQEYFQNYNKPILLVFAFIFSGFVTSRSIIPGLSFSLFSIVWLLYSSPFYFHKKLITVDDKNIFILFFLFIVMSSGAIHFGEKYSNSIVINLTGSIVMYFILISLVQSYDDLRKMIIIHIIITIPIVLVMSYRSWFHFNSLWLSPFWNNNYALGKNTVGFFTVFCFNYLYSYFIYKRSLIKFLGLIILSLATFYTVSRGALISWSMVLILTPFFTKNKRPHVYTFGFLIITFILVTNILNFNPLYTFMEIKGRGSAAQLGYEYNQATTKKFYNFTNSNAPGGKYGLSQRASHWVRTAEKFKEKPIFGFGAGSFHRLEGTLAHNDYLTIIYEYGLVGIIIFLLIGWQHFYLLIRTKIKTPINYRWISEATIVQIIILAFTFLTVDAYMIPFTWYILFISSALIKLSSIQRYI
jgi:hypothetical protein